MAINWIIDWLRSPALHAKQLHVVLVSRPKGVTMSIAGPITQNRELR